ncbi:MAG: response regulator [Gemmatimonadota bacterium]|nr:response regulator [Gemmatimonadota bacterium]
MPLSPLPHRRGSEPDTTGSPLSGTECILLVEDEDALRSLSARVLERYGYQVLEARHGRDALAICEAYPGQIDVVVTDVMMPEMGGGELVARLRAMQPGKSMQVLFISGYLGADLSRQGVIDAGSAFVQKPVTPSALMAKLRELLDRPGASS